MPEGDTVLQAARRLHHALAGQVLSVSDFRVPRYATADLAGSTVLEVVPRGKHLLMRCSGGITVHSHLRMEGSWRTFAAGEPWRGGPGWQIRVVLGNVRHVAVGYRLPVLDILRTGDESKVVGQLGPDVLGPDWDLARVTANALAHPEREIGSVLLDQTVLAGLGNVYRIEACFIAGVSPWTRVGDVPELDTFVDRARQLIVLNAERSVRVTTGSARPGEQLWVYGRGRRPCRRCGTAIRVAEQAPSDAPEEGRVTYWCPRCQRGPAPVGSASYSSRPRG
ncbi:Fpg/Nei family DNA glycosylase [Frankia sp. AgB1.9]|uniref:DNA-formamidopyrimidine glycosylase family protein n=1 Tax=unclassified Frankia TaxID=2632575 RepID=UPI001932FA2D|nr:MULTISPECIES: DNA-formamidopyrimidine glycosylase family protein [unclassified Frankia]MBL7494022.1 Fpg/Nei family DNA glycosylase [Frankia sp. AgW1.1]MBL7549244.1 Fpg/Nei family DNA glycosylase [Frankia sp. AgB1.9]MBL7619461.1 Fpg/Nei family DNA glycosylase [Frankia sp. AgB1.8]